MPRSKPVYLIEMTKFVALTLTVVSLPMVALAIGLVNFLSSNAKATGGNPALMLITYFVTLVIHELVHGLFFALAGGHPRYGAALVHKFLPVFYATAPGKYAYKQMTLMALSPFVLLSIAFGGLIVLMPTQHILPYLLVAFVGNFAGAVGDLYLFAQITRFARFKNLLVEDLKDGRAIHSSDPRAQAFAKKLLKRRQNQEKNTSFFYVWLGSTFAIFILSAVVSGILGSINASHEVIIGAPHFALIDYKPLGDSGLEVTFNFLPAFLLGLLASALYTYTKKYGHIERHTS